MHHQWNGNASATSLLPVQRRPSRSRAPRSPSSLPGLPPGAAEYIAEHGQGRNNRSELSEQCKRMNHRYTTPIWQLDKGGIYS